MCWCLTWVFMWFLVQVFGRYHEDIFCIMRSSYDSWRRFLVATTKTSSALRGERRESPEGGPCWRCMSKCFVLSTHLLVNSWKSPWGVNQSQPRLKTWLTIKIAYSIVKTNAPKMSKINDQRLIYSKELAARKSKHLKSSAGAELDLTNKGMA